MWLFYVAETNPARREPSAEGNGCLYLMGDGAKGNSWIIRDRDKGTGIPGGKERRKLPYPGPSGNEVSVKSVSIRYASAMLTKWRRRGREGEKKGGKERGRGGGRERVRTRRRKGEIYISESHELLLMTVPRAGQRLSEVLVQRA